MLNCKDYYKCSTIRRMKENRLKRIDLRRFFVLDIVVAAKFTLQVKKNKLYYHWMVFQIENCTSTYLFDT